ncbi:hypothetical protein HGP17_16515 [Rhizobium sp. P38BS-XIX]|uniref:hypothetical protein n=1 Tax=Rhizobium sp. P38BS-XIX TaxID=2726740 RepID=UPI0014577F1F|nr:hypothetical protein [Rhizobium sp. P38BS-XIX]NLR98422.1 hypothetical protein [Rhizobium sp. P38BS-XIX]
MTLIPPTPSAALAILKQMNAGAVTPQRSQSVSDGLIAVATGQTKMVSVSKQPTSEQSKISEAIFSVNGKTDVTKMKLDLIYRTGKALGVEHEDYPSMDDFAKAMLKAYRQLEPSEVNAIEHDLGLDKLGLSLLDVIESAKNPERNDKVTRALKQQLDKTNDKGSDDQANQPLIGAPDDADVYQPYLITSFGR